MAFWPVPRYLVLATRQVLGMEQEGHIGDEGGDQVNEVLSGARGGRRRLLKLQGPRGAFPGLAQLDGPAHHLWVRLGEQKGGGLGGRVCPITLLAPIPGSFPSPSPSHKVFVPGSKSISCPARPQDIQNRGEMQIQGGGGGGGMSPASYQHLLAQLDEDEDAGVYHLLALDRPVLEGQVLAFLIQEET